MDIAAMSMHLSSAKAQQSASFAMAKKTMDLQEETSNALLQMMQSSPSFGQKLDVRV